VFYVRFVRWETRGELQMKTEIGQPTKGFSEATQWMNDWLVEARRDAQRQVAKDLREDMRRKAPVFVRRLERSAMRNPVKAAIRDVLKSDHNLTARFLLPQIASQHLWRTFIRPEIAKEIETRKRFELSISVSGVVDEIMESCAIAITAYPEDCKPTLPRRCDVGRAVHRYCRYHMR
jgi:hypothetical protein